MSTVLRAQVSAPVCGRTTLGLQRHADQCTHNSPRAEPTAPAGLVATLRAGQSRRCCRVIAHATGPDEPADVQTQDRTILFAAGTGLALVIAAGFVFFPDTIEEAMLGDGLNGGLLGLGAADYLAAALWSLSLWFVSPLQLLVLFFGKIETERPSDWFMNAVGSLQGAPVKEIGYVHPSYIPALAVATCIAAGTGISAALQWGLGDATWGVSTGIATCMAAGVYEVGRPTRLSSGEAVQLEESWQTFAGFAKERLQKGGRCHESEIWKAFEAEHPRFRMEENKIEPEYLRDMVANWHPIAQRTPSGYYKNVSLKVFSDPFTGKTTGVDITSTSSDSESSTASSL